MNSEPDINDAFEPSERELHILKDRLASRGFYQAAFHVSEMLRQLDRAQDQFVHRNDFL